MVALVLGPGPDTRDIAAGSGFGHCDPQYRLAAYATRQEPFFLLVGAKHSDVGSDQSVMQRQAESRIAAGQCDLLDQDLLITEIRDPQATILLVGPHQTQAVFPGFQKRFAIDDPLLMPALGIRDYLFLKKFPRRVAKNFMLCLEDFSFHH